MERTYRCPECANEQSYEIEGIPPEKECPECGAEMNLAEDVLDDITITAEDMSADRLTELLKHQRIAKVREYNGTFQIVTRQATTINIASPPEDHISGSNTNPHTREPKTGTNDTEGLTTDNILESGDLVRLKRPQTPKSSLPDMTHGIVVEIISKYGDEYDNAPRTVAVHPYNPQTKEIHLQTMADVSPLINDQPTDNLVLVQKASDHGYKKREVDVAEFLGRDD